MERSDIKLEDQKGFYGIAPNKVVGLKYAAPIFIKSVNVVDGIISSVVATLDGAVYSLLIQKNKPNSFLNWISIE